MALPAVRFVHLAKGAASPRLFVPAFQSALRQLGELTLIEQTDAWPEARKLEVLRAHDVVLSGWGGIQVPEALVAAAGRVRYICHLTGTLEGFVSERIVASDLLVTNWGDAPAAAVAEGALALLFACLKNLPAFARGHHGRHPLDGREFAAWNGSIRQVRLGLYGFGAIGREFHNLCRPFNPSTAVYDPYVTKLPPGVTRVADLAALFSAADVVVIHAALTPETRRSVTAGLLARLPDGGIVINTARGDIIDQAALLREVRQGRLRAGLDVLAKPGPDFLADDDPAWAWPNLLVTPHVVERSDWPAGGAADRLENFHHVALENLRRFLRAEPPLNRMTPERLNIST